MMQFFFSEQGRLAELVGLCGILWTLESLIPLYQYPSGRLRHGFPNVGLTALLVLTNLVLSFSSAGLVAFASERHFGFLFLHSLAPAATLIFGVVVLDFLAYV